MANCKPVPTPVDTKPKVSTNDGELLSVATFYHSIAGVLQYLTLTWPDIAYVVNQACLHMHTPRDAHWNLIKQVLLYLRGTMRGTITDNIRVSASSSCDLTVYSDIDWAGCPDTRRSTSGYCIFLGNTLVSWSSKRQTTVSRSSAEAEYRAVANMAAGCCWLRSLLRELYVPVDKAMVIYCDNELAVYLSENPVHHWKTKHVSLIYISYAKRFSWGTCVSFRFRLGSNLQIS
ncbi:uncharacterized protein LOC106804189 [Setaria italica]|uniref:uncharacterized protein LOC106804189 n=1 Tax=Setaria italica TaxID=4555 RepID=UPI00035122C4|nr:uncharacterized protein LOC106804189 [Setaria italica]